MSVQWPAETARNQPNTQDRKTNRRRWRYYYFLYYEASCFILQNHWDTSMWKLYCLKASASSTFLWYDDSTIYFSSSTSPSHIQRPTNFNFFHTLDLCLHPQIVDTVLHARIEVTGRESVHAFWPGVRDGRPNTPAQGPSALGQNRGP